MWSLLIILISQQPELELPHITVYGERETIEALKKSLLPDSVYPLPLLGEYTPKTVKLRARDIVYKKSYTTRLFTEIGSSGKVAIYSGFNQYSLNALYEKDVIGLNDKVEFNIGIPYMRAYYYNVSFKGGEKIKNRRYNQAGFRLYCKRKLFSLDGGYEKNSLAGAEYDKITFGAKYDIINLHVLNKTKIYINHNYLSSLSLNFPLQIGSITFSPGVLGAISNIKNLRRVYPILYIKGTFNKFLTSISYSPYTTILSREEILNQNPFSDNIPYNLNTGPLVELSLISTRGRLKAGYQMNYPIFKYDTTKYSIQDTTSYFIEGLIEFGGLSLEMRYRFNVTDYMPYLYISPVLMMEWGMFDFTLSSPILFRREPGEIFFMPIISLKYSILKNFSLISDLALPFGETILWKGCYEESRKIYIGISANL